MRIRPARTGDAMALARLSDQLGYPVRSEAVGRHLDSVMSAQGHAVFVAEDESGAVHGWLHVFVTRRLFVAPFAELGGMVVDEGYRGRGIGRALLTQAEGWAAQSGCGLIRIRTNIQRSGAHAFYDHLGYAVSKSQHVFEKQLPKARSG